MKKVLICAPVKQKPEIFKEYIESLDRLIVPEGYEVTHAFYLHGDDDYCKLMRGYLTENDVIYTNNTETEFKVQGTAHLWGNDNFLQVAWMKNELIKYAIDNDFDYWFMVDSDLILNPHTLEKLIENDKDICAEIFWTEYQEGSGQLSPNCWDFDAMGFNETIGGKKRYMIRGVHKTGGTGACILVKTDVFRSGVNYNRIYNVSCTNWEDRAFSIRAAVAGYELYIDSTLSCRHLYKPSDYEKWMKYKLEIGIRA
jgi:hypothetical protein